MTIGRPHTCPYCKGTKTIWKGFRRLARGKVRLRKCSSCARKFTTRHKISPDDDTYGALF